MGLDTRPDYVLALGIAFIVVCPIVVGLRFYTRVAQKSGIGVDDWLTIPALLMVIGCGVDLVIGVKLKVYGYPTPKPSSSQDAADFVSWNFSEAEKLQVAFLPMQAMAMGLVKLSFIFLFRRVFLTGKAKSKFNLATWIATLIIVLWLITFLFWQLFSCGSHFTARWQKPSIERTQCSTGLKDMYGLAVSDFLTDVLIFALPMPMIWRLKMKFSRKMAILAVFGFASLTIIASIIRLAIFLHDLKISHQLSSHASLDQILIMTQALYWSMLEAGLALIASCLPIIISLVRRRVERSRRPGSPTSERQRITKPRVNSVVSDATTLATRHSALGFKDPRGSDGSGSPGGGGAWLAETISRGSDEIVAVPAMCYSPLTPLVKEKAAVV